MTAPLVDGPVRWGVAGTGRIARGVMRELVEVVAPHGGGVLAAVGSRSPERAEAFAREVGGEAGEVRAHGSYRDLLADPGVDAVYIATPHPQHHALALAAIDAGRHLLVEKAFTATLAGSEEVVAAARAAGVFVMEAMWTRFQPAVVRLRELVDQGAVGEVRSVQAELGLAKPFDPADRLWDPAQGGGALLDLGVYPVSFAQMVLGGRAEGVQVAGGLAGNGVDAESTVLLTFDGGHAVASSSLLTRLPGRAAVHGTEGWVEVPPRFHHPDRVVLHRREGDAEAAPEEVVLPAAGAGYSHELDEVHRCLAAGLTESPVMPLDDTLAVMEALERALHTLGWRPAEDPRALDG